MLSIGLQQAELKKIYEQYGFEEQASGVSDVYVYTLRIGVFSQC